MTARELIEQLQKLPPDTKVYTGCYCEDTEEVVRVKVVEKAPFMYPDIPIGSVIIECA